MQRAFTVALEERFANGELSSLYHLETYQGQAFIKPNSMKVNIFQAYGFAYLSRNNRFSDFVSRAKIKLYGRSEYSCLFQSQDNMFGVLARIKPGTYNNIAISPMYSGITLFDDDYVFASYPLEENEIVDVYMKHENGKFTIAVQKNDYEIIPIIIDQEFPNLLTCFDKVFLTPDIDNTVDSQRHEGTAFDLITAQGQYRYIGSKSAFESVYFEIPEPGSYAYIKIEYFNGSEWVDLDHVDGTAGFTLDGAITFELPQDFSKTTIEGVEYYYIRISAGAVDLPAKVKQITVDGQSRPKFIDLKSGILNYDDNGHVPAGEIYLIQDAVPANSFSL